MNKEEVHDFLKKNNIKFELDEHIPVFNMNDLKKVSLKYQNYDGKNIFLRDDKKENYYLVTVLGNKKIDLKKFRIENGLRHLSFASDVELYNYLKLIPGAVTPLGLLNDKDKVVKFYIDDNFFKDPFIIGVHPNDNSATVWLNVNDLVSVIKNNGNEVHLTKI